MLIGLRRGRKPDSGDETSQRTANVGFAGDLLETEIAQRNARKDAQEATARWVVLTAGALMTLLLTLAKEAGILAPSASGLVRGFFIGALAAATGAAIGAIGALWPRQYDRLGKKGLTNFNQTAFLDRPTHEVTGQVVATRIGMAKTMDENHEGKAKWLKGGFICLGIALACLLTQGVALAIDPPQSAGADTPAVTPGATNDK